jgi:hypothetical protein
MPLHAKKNLLMYFTRERDNNGPLLPVGAVQERVAQLFLGIIRRKFQAKLNKIITNVVTT